MSYIERHYTSYDGLSLYFREYGKGTETAICLPGLTRNCKDFEKLAEHLADRYRVITPDLRGRGQSDRDPRWKQYLPPTYVKDTWTLMDTLGIESAAIIGTSLGGIMAMIMADQQPDRLRGVVLNDVGPHVPVAAQTRLLEYVGRTPPQSSWEVAADVTCKNYELAYPDEDSAFWARQVRLAWREGEDGRPEPDYDPAIGDALRHVMKSMGLVRLLQRIGVRRLKGLNLDPWDNFKQMDMPLLVIRGELSDILEPETLATMRELKPGMKVVGVPGRGHAPTLDEPVAREAIDDFLDRLE
ncbi:MAG TPA: alpha/beta hydrolase [Xanthomonadales bacterium]|nr:alpha/beta hydrolase [Xanthomonadales bacterium]